MTDLEFINELERMQNETLEAIQIESDKNTNSSLYFYAEPKFTIQQCNDASDMIKKGWNIRTSLESAIGINKINELQGGENGKSEVYIIAAMISVVSTL